MSEFYSQNDEANITGKKANAANGETSGISFSIRLTDGAVKSIIESAAAAIIAINGRNI